LYTAGGTLVNNEWLSEQTQEFQKAVAESAAIAQAYSGPELKITEEAMMNRIKEKGMEVIELDDKAKTEFKEVSMSTWEEAAKIIGVDYFNTIKTSIEKMK
jgi:TRAP-type C4-dicarboxylate transport system substrate-binding protein